MSDNARVAAAATSKEAIPLDRLTLIGLFGTDSDRRALVRHASGRVQTVKLGDRVSGRRAVAISADSLFLRTGSGTTRLEMPSG